MTDINTILSKLPGLNCGLCGSKSCEDFANIVSENPTELQRCIHIDAEHAPSSTNQSFENCRATCNACTSAQYRPAKKWKDSLDREYDFILDSLPNDPGPREVIRPHNPMLTRELNIQKGDILIGRPLGMSCGCPITHCGIVMNVDPRTGVMDWCVTGPLGPRNNGYKDIGYYSAEAYEGIVRETQKELKIGMRYWFQPHRCMLQWRHSGLINFINQTPHGHQVRIEGLFIG
ncbi:MAG: Fe-S cluster protein [Phycisphaerae bacterium]|nr:Fe-S cluster protein [Phycisphaerae bacterium]